MHWNLRAAGLAALAVLSIVAAAALSYLWDEVAAAWSQGAEKEAAADREAEDEGRGHGRDREAPDEDEEDGKAGESTPAVSAPSVGQPAWVVVKTTGEEGNPVDVEYDPERGWQITGWRVKGLSLYGAPHFEVQARKVDDIPKFPCSDCHKKMEVDHRPRVLTEEHEDLAVNHANDRIWCTDCHAGKGLDFLASRRGNPIDMDLGYLHCGECHFDQAKDWEFGVHGRRVGLWHGDRVLRTCTECHDAHQPQIKPLKPTEPPRYRANLNAFAPHPVQHKPIWERVSTGRTP